LPEEIRSPGALNGREFKARVFSVLMSRDLENDLEQLKKLPLPKVLRPLLSALHSSDEKIKWATVTAIGILIANLAGKDMEAARNFMRRFMWSLNDESGNIGWGLPEVMGETLARSARLAE